MMRHASVLVIVALSTILPFVAPGAVGSVAAQSGATSLGLDYDFYRDRVEPILLARRPGNARCVVCHSRGGGNSYLEPLAPGATTYNEEQSLRNFERIQRLVVPGAPTESVLLMNPLAEEAGGSHWHGGGKHWESRTDAEWQTLAEWVDGTTIMLD
jgi:hypothetical protein